MTWTIIAGSRLSQDFRVEFGKTSKAIHFIFNYAWFVSGIFSWRCSRYSALQKSLYGGIASSFFRKEELRLKRILLDANHCYWKFYFVHSKRMPLVADKLLNTGTPLEQTQVVLRAWSCLAWSDTHIWTISLVRFQCSVRLRHFSKQTISRNTPPNKHKQNRWPPQSRQPQLRTTQLLNMKGKKSPGAIQWYRFVHWRILSLWILEVGRTYNLFSVNTMWIEARSCDRQSRPILSLTFVISTTTEAVSLFTKCWSTSISISCHSANSLNTNWNDG